MDQSSIPDLDGLDRDRLVALVLEHQEKLTALIAARDEELRLLEAELDAHRHILSQQADELRSRSEHIEDLKLMVDKFRHMIFGTKSEKIVIRLEQFELELEESETTQAEVESAVECISPLQQPKPTTACKPLPEQFLPVLKLYAPPHLISIDRDGHMNTPAIALCNKRWRERAALLCGLYLL